jgi:hypothetical protein
MATTLAPPDPYRLVIEQRIATLLEWRRWYRANRWADWSDLRREHTAELRSLVRLARAARKAETPDPIDTYKAWTEPELRESFGG